MKKLCLLAAVITWLLIPAVSAAELPQAGQPAGATGVSMHGEAGAALKQDLRKLWTDHVARLRCCLRPHPEDVGRAAEGIVKQFPEKFGLRPTASTGKH